MGVKVAATKGQLYREMFGLDCCGRVAKQNASRVALSKVLQGRRASHSHTTLTILHSLCIQEPSS